MEKLFSDAETFTKVRPTKITEKQKQEFYKSIAEEIIKNGWSDSDLEDVIHDVSKISPHDNGYEIAKYLEGFGSKAIYDIDTSFIQFLDDFDFKKYRILEKTIETWVSAHNPQPKFQKGQKLIIEIPLNPKEKKGDIVYVTGFSEHRACYLIHKDEKRSGGYVIAYEKVEANCLLI
jgi:hypothetical protein